MPTSKTAKIHILGLTPEELSSHLSEISGGAMPKFRAKQILEWIYQKRASSFEHMTNLSKPDRTLLAEHFDIFTSSIVRNLTSADGTQKILLEWPAPPLPPDAPQSDAPPDAGRGGLTECVMIP